MSAHTPVHVAPLLMLRDTVAFLILALGLNDHFRPEHAWVVEHLRVAGYTWVLLGVGAALALWTLVSWVWQWRGVGLVASHHFSD